MMETLACDRSFEATVRRPADAVGPTDWAFVVLPTSESEKFPRRGRTSAEGTINGHPLRAMLEPDGQLSHWLRIPKPLMDMAGIAPGQIVTLALRPCAEEMEPSLPADFSALLDASPDARATWEATTTIARIDWIHWIESAKQAKTRSSRMADACQMLASGKKRVCCFDQSGYYSKSMCAPREG